MNQSTITRPTRPRPTVADLAEKTEIIELMTAGFDLIRAYASVSLGQADVPLSVRVALESIDRQCVLRAGLAAGWDAVLPATVTA